MSGTDRHDPLLDGVAASISDGEGLDWTELRRRMTDEADTAVLDELQVLDGIAQVHRNQWGTLEILEPIGHGAFGTVYRAFDRDLLRHVALKLTRAAADSPTFDPERLVREAQRLARVKHTNVVTVLSAERKGNEVGVVMEWLKGQTLDAIVQAQGPLGAREVAVIGIDLCRALAAVHGAGLLHGDVKAHNVMREEGGRIVLMDFGASRDLSQAPASGRDFAGTPLYIAPEVFAGAPRSAASDVYSLGVLLYYLASGRYPVDGDTRSAIDRQHAQTTGHRHLRDARPDLSDAFVHIVQRAIAQNPADRYSTAGTLEQALSGFLGGESITPTPRPRHRLAPLLVAGVAVATVIIALLFWQRNQTTKPAETLSSTTAAEVTAPSPPQPYEIEAAMYRVDPNHSVRLGADDTVKPGDRLFLQVRASVPAHIYVVNEDDDGHHYLLFPLNGYSQANPLTPDQVHVLPGTRGDMEHYWQVTVPGGREHFVIFVSPTPLTNFEKAFAEMPRASEDTPVFSAPISANALNTLRGVGGVVAATTPRLDQPLHEQYHTPLPNKGETTTGVWVRKLTVASMP
jgi:eukaryotic-like serine/threonine-protein kinase